MIFKKNRVQVFNPKGKYWVKINTKSGRVLGHKDSPWKNIKRCRKRKQLISMTYELNNKPIKESLRVFVKK